MTVYLKRVCNLSEYIQQPLLCSGCQCVRTDQQLGQLGRLRTYDLYTLPINLEARRAGKT